MNDFPLVTVITPNWNTSGLIIAYLESVKKQDYPLNKIEIIIVDNGSSDDSKVKIKALYTDEYVFHESKARTVLAAKINLNTLHPTEINSLNARTFEIAGIGGFQMIHWQPGLADLFKDGEKLVSFKNFNELIQKINYYLSNENIRNEIARAGQKRAYGYHTYELRMKLIFETINGKAKGYEFKNYAWTN